MSQVLDTIIISTILEGPETVSTTLVTDSVDISGIEESVALHVIWTNGSGSPDVDFSLDVSMDDINWVNIAGTVSNQTDVEGLGIFDIATTGVSFIRLRVEVASGQIDISSVILSGKRRH